MLVDKQTYFENHHHQKKFTVNFVASIADFVFKS